MTLELKVTDARPGLRVIAVDTLVFVLKLGQVDTGCLSGIASGAVKHTLASRADLGAIDCPENEAAQPLATLTLTLTAGAAKVLDLGKIRRKVGARVVRLEDLDVIAPRGTRLSVRLSVSLDRVVILTLCDKRLSLAHRVVAAKRLKLKDFGLKLFDPVVSCLDLVVAVVLLDTLDNGQQVTGVSVKVRDLIVNGSRKLKRTSEQDVKDIVIPLLLFDRTRLASLCLLYTSPSPRDRQKSRMPSSA